MDNQTQMEWKDCFKKGNQGARDKHLGPPRPRPGDMALELALPLSPGLSHTHTQPRGQPLWSWEEQEVWAPRGKRCEVEPHLGKWDPWASPPPH